MKLKKNRESSFIKIDIPVTDFTIPFESLPKDAINIAGGKMFILQN